MKKKNHTILIVEDDADILSAIDAIVQSFGYHTIATRSASEALEKAKSSTIHLGLIDIMMPEMDGYELLVELRKLGQYATLPVIMVTAKDRDDDMLEGYRYGADYYIPKPFTSEQLSYGIRLFLDPDSVKLPEKE